MHPMTFEELKDQFSPGTVAFGDAFEHFLILEIYRLNSYLQKDYRLSYFMTKEGQEIDVVLSRGRKIIALEIKSKEKIDQDEVTKLSRLGEEIGATEKYYLSRDPNATLLQGVQCLPWQEGLARLFS
jgi:predicted AAA+ superfamily ATPase